MFDLENRRVAVVYLAYPGDTGLSRPGFIRVFWEYRSTFLYHVRHALKVLVQFFFCINNVLAKRKTHPSETTRHTLTRLRVSSINNKHQISPLQRMPQKNDEAQVVIALQAVQNDPKLSARAAGETNSGLRPLSKAT
jgi:hypothetical protein